MECEDKWKQVCDYCIENNIEIPKPDTKGEMWYYNLKELSIEQYEAINKIWNGK